LLYTGLRTPRGVYPVNPPRAGRQQGSTGSSGCAGSPHERAACARASSASPGLVRQRLPRAEPRTPCRRGFGFAPRPPIRGPLGLVVGVSSRVPVRRGAVLPREGVGYASRTWFRAPRRRHQRLPRTRAALHTAPAVCGTPTVREVAPGTWL